MKTKNNISKSKRNILVALFILIGLVIIAICFLYARNNNEDNEYDASNGEIILIEEGLMQSKYNGEYMFDEFLAVGGAKANEEVIEFIEEYIVGSSKTLKGSEGSNFACTTVQVKNETDGYLFGRNFDLEDCNALVVTSNPKKGYKSVSTVNMDFLTKNYSEIMVHFPDKFRTIVSLYMPLDGMNEKGLCVALLSAKGKDEERYFANKDTEKSDLTPNTAIRLLLDNAATTDEAISLLKKYDMHFNEGEIVHFAISDKFGRSYAVEYIDSELVVTETKVLTNNLIAEIDENNNLTSSNSQERFEIVTSKLSEKDTMSEDELKDLMNSVSTDNFNEDKKTQWTIIYNQEETKAKYYHRENYESYYEFEVK